MLFNFFIKIKLKKLKIKISIYSEHVEIGKQSFLKKRWKFFLKSSSLFVRIIVARIV